MSESRALPRPQGVPNHPPIVRNILQFNRGCVAIVQFCELYALASGLFEVLKVSAIVASSLDRADNLPLFSRFVPKHTLHARNTPRSLLRDTHVKNITEIRVTRPSRDLPINRDGRPAVVLHQKYNLARTWICPSPVAVDAVS